MAEVVWTEPALAELDAIAAYIALDNPTAARRLVQDIFNRTDQLEAFPLSGRILPELPNTIYRELVVPPCRIIYRETKQCIIVVYVMRVERQLRALMLNEASPNVLG